MAAGRAGFDNGAGVWQEAARCPEENSHQPARLLFSVADQLPSMLGTNLQNAFAGKDNDVFPLNYLSF